MNLHECITQDVPLPVSDKPSTQPDSLQDSQAELTPGSDDGVREWQRLLRHRRELAEWLVDSATDESGRLTESAIDAGLRGESFVPCSFTAYVNGQRYRFDLQSTAYEIRRAAHNG